MSLLELCPGDNEVMPEHGGNLFFCDSIQCEWWKIWWCGIRKLVSVKWKYCLAALNGLTRLDAWTTTIVVPNFWKLNVLAQKTPVSVIHKSNHLDYTFSSILQFKHCAYHCIKNQKWITRQLQLKYSYHKSRFPLVLSVGCEDESNWTSFAVFGGYYHFKTLSLPAWTTQDILTLVLLQRNFLSGERQESSSEPCRSIIIDFFCNVYRETRKYCEKGMDIHEVFTASIAC